MRTQKRPDSARCFHLLSLLGLSTDRATPKCDPSWHTHEQITNLVSELEDSEWSELLTLAGKNHALLRTLPKLMSLPSAGRPDRISRAIEAEQDRIDHALGFLESICSSLSEAGKVVVIKTLDHWPDFGSDLDLYTDAASRDVIAIMQDQFKARVANPSWGDRLANKCNFEVPGLPELVEVHIRRLGQTGEQSRIGRYLMARAREGKFGGRSFLVPSPEDRMIISTLQRMFRHFYIRLCDVLNLCRSADEDRIDYDYLHSLAKPAGLWEGVATYLNIVSAFVEGYRGRGMQLPASLKAAAQFGGEKIRFGKQFLRIPIVPHSARLYAAELKELLWSGELENSLRLGLLPFLATAAAVEYKITGSDKGIW
ncbi:MAG TPA: nucleotidyltransferase family protein [Candidatus Sulfotelmatobacter sp.]|nr:nucleotidyltransferase family protein [Candidatus Sulfotelmatobacter sp.]